MYRLYSYSFFFPTNMKNYDGINLYFWRSRLAYPCELKNANKLSLWQKVQLTPTLNTSCGRPQGGKVGATHGTRLLANVGPSDDLCSNHYTIWFEYWSIKNWKCCIINELKEEWISKITKKTYLVKFKERITWKKGKRQSVCK